MSSAKTVGPSARKVWLLVAVLVPATAARPQSYYDVNKKIGAPETLYRADIDNVSLVNGNLTLKIPLLHLPGRGIDTEFLLTYNSKVWKSDYYPWDGFGWPGGTVITSIEPDAAGGGFTGGPSPFVPFTGWRLGIPRMGQFTTAWEDCTHFREEVGVCELGYLYRTWVQNDGTRSDTSSEVIIPQYLGGGLWSSYVTSDQIPVWSYDGSYLRGISPYHGGSANPSATVRYKDGLTVVQTWRGVPHTTILRDPNGNQITCTRASCLDTVGRSINYNYSPSGVLQSLTYTDSSGSLQTITFSHEPFTLNYPAGFHVPGFEGEPQGFVQRYSDVPLLTEVRLPNQRGTYFGTGFTDPVQVRDPLGNIQTYWNVRGLGIPARIERKNPAGTLVQTETLTVAFDPSIYYNARERDEPQYIINRDLPPSNPRIVAREKILNDTNQRSQEVLSYGSHGNVTRRDEYDWGSPGAGPLVRQTTYSYLHNANPNYADRSVHILDRVTTQNACNAAGSFCANTNADYDQTLPTVTSNVVQHVDPYPSTDYRYNLRGNPTRIRRWRNMPNPAWLDTINTYNDLGKLLTTTDPSGHTTSFNYADNFYNVTPSQPTLAYVTSVTHPATGAVNHIERSQYYFDSGLAAASCGQNFPAVAACAFGLAAPESDYADHQYDGLNRPTITRYGDGGASRLEHNESVLPINIAHTTRITAASVNPPSQTDTLNSLVNVTRYDGLGRVAQSELRSDPQGAVFTDITYDALGRKKTVSNAYRSTSDPTYGVTEFEYDALSRVTKVIPPDGTPTSNNVTTTYSGNTTTVTDQAGKKRKSETDALGRLTRVWEPDAAGAFLYETAYQYDVLDNLTRVEQKGNDPNSANWRTRTFAYNSLSQLTSAANPESGTVTYTYDNDGNLIRKVSPQPNQTNPFVSVTTTLTYDALHRLTGKSYDDGTATVTYGYDGATPTGCTPTLVASNPVGRRTGMCDAAGWSAWSYDAMGRVLTDSRRTNGVSRDFVYSYNLDGSVATLRYPSGRVITYAYNAAARPLSAVDTPNSVNYALSASYAAQGALSSLLVGKTASFGGINLNLGYNNRLQPGSIRAWSTNGTVLDLTYCFNVNMNLATHDCAVTPVINNGNVVQIKNNLNVGRTQNFAYDELNRIKSAVTQATSGQYCWGQLFGEMIGENYLSGYDIWGNLLKMNQLATHQGCGSGLLNLTVNTRNQISSPFTSYDAAGNLMIVSLFGYMYDAESRMTYASGFGYTYDGEGRRVQKSSGRLYWYGTGGEILAESDAAGNITDEYIFFGGRRIARRDSAGNVFYYLADHLGSSRVVTRADGTSCYDADYYPFGGERVHLYSCSERYRFTGKERDSTESGFDYFGARYYSSGDMRFISPDPVLTSRNLENPQSLNKYTYAFNQPTRLRDLDGAWPTEFHHQIIRDVFGDWGRNALRTLMISSDWVDALVNQAPSRSHMHAMSDGTVRQSAAEAERAATDYVETELNAAVQAQIRFERKGGKGYLEQAMERLGHALHTVTDQTSPLHAGYQPWYGLLTQSAIDHRKAEDRAARPGNMAAAEARHEAYVAARVLRARFEEMLKQERERNEKENQNRKCETKTCVGVK